VECVETFALIILDNLTDAFYYLYTNTNMDNQIQNTIKSHEDQIDFIARKMIEHDEQFSAIKEEMVTKNDLRNISKTLDKLVGLVETQNQEIVMISHGMKRHEESIEKIEEDIRQIKPALGLS